MKMYFVYNLHVHLRTFNSPPWTTTACTFLLDWNHNLTYVTWIHMYVHVHTNPLCCGSLISSGVKVSRSNQCTIQFDKTRIFLYIPGLMIPTIRAMDLAVIGWSPVTIITYMYVHMCHMEVWYSVTKHEQRYLCTYVNPPPIVTPEKKHTIQWHLYVCLWGPVSRPKCTST